MPIYHVWCNLPKTVTVSAKSYIGISLVKWAKKRAKKKSKKGSKKGEGGVGLLNF